MPRANKINTLWEFTVEGNFDFPFDMLRYDSCWPKSETRDSVALAPHHRSEAFRTNRQVTLVSIKEPTEGRWASFGWKVIETKVRNLG